MAGRLRTLIRALVDALRARRWREAIGILRGVRPGARPAPEAASGRWVVGTARYGVVVRDYKLFLPAGLGAGPVPLVVMLHGCRQDPDDFAAGTAMNELAAVGQVFADGCLVLYPAQSRRANRFGCWNWFQLAHQQRGFGEAELIARLVREVIATRPVDPRRVYVAGLSAGGAMAAVLANAWPELFAAFGVHSGVPVGAARGSGTALAVMKFGPIAGRPTLVPDRPLPIIVFQGDDDTTVHPENAARLVADASEAWSAVTGEGLDVDRQEVAGDDSHHGFQRETWRDRDGRVVVDYWRIRGLGHAWSGGREEGSYTDRAGPDASATMLRFFSEHVQPAADARG